ncbi:MAG: UTP--glucose-1-phosphate uridylyltransferase, partial [Chthoniobacterales bacterium]
MNERGLESALSKMKAAGLSDAVCASFARAWRQAASGQAGLMPEAQIDPAEGIPSFAEVTSSAHPEPSLLDKLCVIKLNGGLGTSMGLERAKSLIPVKDGLNFLDFIARQILHLRSTHGTKGPRFLLMDSFSTSADTLKHLAAYPDLSSGGPLDFLQNKVPKLAADTLEPVDWAKNRDLEWCPPGHGDLYPSLLGSGLLEQLASEGVEYLFVSHSDNLGATVDLGLLAYFAGSGLSFLMEVAERTASDRKGGHLARRKSGGRLVLREIAQC